MMNQLEVEVKRAVELANNGKYKNDPWLWNLDWKGASKKTKKRRYLDEILGEATDLQNDKYPVWFQDLADEENGKAFLNITLSKRVVPKILRLTWKGYPMHFDMEDKWGYLTPAPDAESVLEAVQSGEIVTEFPLKEYLSIN